MRSRLLRFMIASHHEVQHRVDVVLQLREKANVPCKQISKSLLRARMRTRTPIKRVVDVVQLIPMIGTHPVSANVDRLTIHRIVAAQGAGLCFPLVFL